MRRSDDAGRMVHERIADQAGRTPEAVAVVAGQERLSYRALEARANQLARYLQAAGVGPESVVGVSLHRTPQLVVTILGVLKAGAAYLALDPAEPRERASFMCEDASVQMLLDQRRLDRVRAQIDAAATTAPESRACPSNLAYVIYTSGSTGMPKGVMVQHDQLLNYLLWATEAYRVEHGRGAPLHSPLTFDLSVTALFTPLLCGRQVAILPEENPPVTVLPKALERGGFSFVKLTPAHLRLLAEALPQEAARGALRRLIVGGEALTYEEVSWWASATPELPIVNEYGPAETVVGCCAFEYPAGEAGSGSVPIGNAVASARLAVLGGDLQPVEDGEVGELYIGGPSVTRGYLRRPALTADRFVPDPFGEAPGARLYATGDRVCRRTDGNLVFVGRADDQVKVRGYRLELGEVEAVLRAHPDVEAAAVALRQDGSSEPRLVGYLVGRGTSRPAAHEVLDFVAERLPGHMVPAAIVWMEWLPLSRHGKLDRARLPAPLELPIATMALRTAAEEAVAQHFRELLQCDAVGADSDFFILGGSSLQVAVLIARLMKSHQVDEVPVERWLEVPTVAGFARILEVSRHQGRETERPLLDQFSPDLGLDSEILDTLAKEGSRGAR